MQQPLRLCEMCGVKPAQVRFCGNRRIKTSCSWKNKNAVERARYYANQDKRLAQIHKWYLANKDKKNEVVRQWYQRNKERCYAVKCIWKSKNPALVSLYHRNWVARKAGSTADHTLEEWNVVLEAFNHRCANCGSAERLTEDHKVPLSLGGQNSIDNIQPLCHSCNSKKWKRIQFAACDLLSKQIILLPPLTESAYV